ncbi:MAG TPA: DUF5700 domain-containing putative Zn-dependent protease [Gammaproteobacteria bacterium]|nr:DUF5700 domain-containing putative Zn-dependent protease [Gammaproteobacteria bacterium]
MNKSVMWQFAAGMISGFFLPLALAHGQLSDRVDSGKPARSSLVITYDFSGARSLIDLLSSESASAEKIKRLESLPSVRAMIEQAGRFDSHATPARFESSLKIASLRQPLNPDDDPFNFSGVLNSLPKDRTLITELEDNPSRFSEDILRRIEPYMPTGLRLSVPIHFVVGGNSDGWARGNEGFYVALQYFKGDYQGLVVVASHEIYHIIQYQVMLETTSSAGTPTQRNVENLLINTFMEGTATVVGDPTDVTDGGDYIQWFKQKYADNLQRLPDDYALFDTLLFRAANDPAVDYQELYQLGFSGAWGSPLYFVGYNMAKIIIKYEGHQRLASFLTEPVDGFFKNYIQLCKLHKDDKLCIPVSPVVTRLIMHRKSVQ